MGKTYYVAGIPFSDELYHHGIHGMRHGHRRYQYKDGTLTPAGKARYLKGGGILNTIGNAVSGAARSVGNFATNTYNTVAGRVNGSTARQARYAANRARSKSDFHNLDGQLVRAGAYDRRSLRERANEGALLDRRAEMFENKARREESRSLPYQAQRAKTAATNAYNAGRDAFNKVKGKAQNAYNDLSGKTYRELQDKASREGRHLGIYSKWNENAREYTRAQNDQVRNTLNEQSSAARNKAKNADLDALLAAGRGLTSSDLDNYRGTKARRKESESQLQDAQRRLADSVRNRKPEASWDERRSHANEEALLERNVERAANKARNEKIRSANVDALGSRRAEQFANKAREAKKDSANVDALSERRREQLATKENNQRKAHANESAWRERNAERLQNKADQAYNRSFNGRVENAREAISNTASNVSQAAQDYAERIGDIVEDAYGDVAEYLGKNAKKAKKAAQQAAKSIKDAGSKGVSAVTGAANKAYSQVASFLGGLFGKKK